MLWSKTYDKASGELPRRGYHRSPAECESFWIGRDDSNDSGEEDSPLNCSINTSDSQVLRPGFPSSHHSGVAYLSPNRSINARDSDIRRPELPKNHQNGLSHSNPNRSLALEFQKSLRDWACPSQCWLQRTKLPLHQVRSSCPQTLRRAEESLWKRTTNAPYVRRSLGCVMNPYL